jgi:hypothetical protein
MSVGLVAVTAGFLAVTTGLSYRNCNLARPLNQRFHLIPPESHLVLHSTDPTRFHQMIPPGVIQIRRACESGNQKSNEIPVGVVQAQESRRARPGRNSPPCPQSLWFYIGPDLPLPEDAMASGRIPMWLDSGLESTASLPKA